ncbi:MAG TPA: mechanosensitive ion channel domain-containing protein [Pyrinomonadaceae bacterium]|jgi:small-conductance mechanosensitive channel|nr:mechanosensitive ion channel domain-containing protein [Pyrinomonadaceae bacterium]
MLFGGTDYLERFPAFILILSLDWRPILSRIWHLLDDPRKIGNFWVSVTTLIEGLVIIIVALLLSRTVSAFLQRRIAKRAYLDPGLSYTLGRLAQYLIMTLGILLALKAAFSLDLTSILVFFTAISVGIGFGLQYIAADIASGFILLFERPVRVGDRISIGKEEGDVQSINLRTTVMTTNDRVSVIVPNSKLVREQLINWSYGDPRARMSIHVGVAYGSDVNLVTETLLKATEDVDSVLRDPQPKVQFLKFGDWSLDFRLLVWTNRPRLHAQIRSDINYRIERLFREARIEIPFPQTELRVREGAVLIDSQGALRVDGEALESEPRRD